MVKRQSYAAQVNQPKPQSVQTKPAQVKNDAGGFVYTADQWVHLNRFMILGSESNSYYVGAEAKTFEAYEVIQACLKADGKRVVDMAVEVSQGGYAPKNDAAIWVLSMACAPKYASADVNKYALEHVYLVCRTLSHLYQFVEMVQQSRGWGRGLRSAVAKWFEFMGFHGAAYQAIKYRQRNGWTGRDILRLAHVPIINAELNAIFRWLTGNSTEHIYTVKRVSKVGVREETYPALNKFLPDIIRAFETVQMMQVSGQVQKTGEWEKGAPSENPLEAMTGGLAPVVQAETVEAETMRLIEKFGLTWEMLPTQMLNSAKIWEALIPHMPYTALQRNLATMTRAGVFASKEMVKLVAERLTNQEAIVKARIHPINLLAAQMTYAQGKGMRGGNEWTPVRQITEALDAAFPLAFKAIEPTGLNILVAIDVSSSMLHGLVCSAYRTVYTAPKGISIKGKATLTAPDRTYGHCTSIRAGKCWVMPHGVNASKPNLSRGNLPSTDSLQPPLWKPRLSPIRPLGEFQNASSDR